MLSRPFYTSLIENQKRRRIWFSVKIFFPPSRSHSFVALSWSKKLSTRIVLLLSYSLFSSSVSFAPPPTRLSDRILYQQIETGISHKLNFLLIGYDISLFAAFIGCMLPNIAVLCRKKLCVAFSFFPSLLTFPLLLFIQPLFFFFLYKYENIFFRDIVILKLYLINKFHGNFHMQPD